MILIFRSDVIAAHAVWLSGAENSLIKIINVKISHNPLSNMKLASGISPVSDLLAMMYVYL
jgi:5-methylthioadenosine/S-adenosylhomocysteine deaminase